MKKIIYLKAFFIFVIFLFLLLPSIFISTKVIEAETDPITLKALVLCFDPIIENEGNQRLHVVCGDVDPHLYVDTFIQEISSLSGGKINYQVAEWINIDSFIPYTNGFQYTDETFMNCWHESGAPYYGWWGWSGWPPEWPGAADYNWIINQYNLIDKVNSGQIDEVFLSAHPRSGLYESLMVGESAFWCNSSPIIRNDVKNFIMEGGFGYSTFPLDDYSVGCMLEDFCHRTESIMMQVYGWPDYSKPFEQMTTWEKFTLYDKVVPGKSAVGNCHFAPNSESDYDWGNTKYVYSTCDDWLNYPNLTSLTKYVNCSEWGNGSMTAHHQWWLNHLPKADGIGTDGKLNNWWYYITDLDLSSLKTDFVTRIYSLCLGRTLDPSGLAYWVDGLNSGVKTGEDLGYGFVMSDEYKAKNTSNTDFVTMLYNVFLNRAPDSSGLAFWVEQLNTMATRPGVLNGFIHSAEFNSICSSYGITAYKTGLAGFVNRFYTLTLERLPDEQGLSYWVSQLQTGTKTGADIAYGFIFSPEFIAKNYPNAKYISILYNAFFDRVPDADGYSNWLGQLNSGKSRQYILDQFIASAEFSTICDSYGIVRGATASSLEAESAQALNIDIEPGSYDFGYLDIGASSSVGFTLTNNGSSNIDIGNIELTGENKDEFSIVINTENI